IYLIINTLARNQPFSLYDAINVVNLRRPDLFNHPVRSGRPTDFYRVYLSRLSEAKMSASHALTGEAVAAIDFPDLSQPFGRKFNTRADRVTIGRVAIGFGFRSRQFELHPVPSFFA